MSMTQWWKALKESTLTDIHKLRMVSNLVSFSKTLNPTMLYASFKDLWESTPHLWTSTQTKENLIFKTLFYPCFQKWKAN